MIYDIKRSGACIRNLRKIRGLTQEALAEELNVDRSLISHVEAGRRGCSVDLLVQISEFFDVSLDLVVLGKEPPASLSTERDSLKICIGKLIEYLEYYLERL